MATEAQLRANRNNAKRSTGPKTPEGKRIACQNSFKHGYYSRATLAFEDFGEEYIVLRERLTEEYAPASQLEHEFVDQIASGLMELHRYRRAEIGFFNQAFARGRVRIITALSTKGDTSRAFTLRMYAVGNAAALYSS